MKLHRYNLPPKDSFYPDKKILLSITLFLLIGLAQFAHSLVPHCSSIFINGVQTHGGNNNFIQFDYNARITNTSSIQLQTWAVRTNPWSQYKTCGNSTCSPYNGQVQKLFKEIPQGPSPDLDVIIPSKSKMTLGADNNQNFGLVKILEDGTAVFSSRHSLYAIDRLYVGYKATLRLPAGEYWIRDLQMEAASRIEVIGEGTVNLYFSNSILIPFKASLNENTKNPAKLAIHAESSSHFDVSSKTWGFVITDNEFILGHSAKITGGIVGQFIYLQSESEIAYDPQAAQRVNFIDLCVPDDVHTGNDTTPPVLIDQNIPWPVLMDRFTYTGVVSDRGEYASGLASVVVRTEEAEFTASLIGESFSVELPLKLGYNAMLLVMTDNAGNVSTEQFYAEYRSTPEFKNIVFNQDPIVRPDLLITGEIHTKWPLDEIILTVDDLVWPIVQVSEGIYSFEIPYTLIDSRHKIDLIVEVPEDEPVTEEFDIMWDPPRIEIVFDSETNEVTTETTLITGRVWVSPYYAGNFIGIVLTSDRFPQLELDVVLQPTNTIWKTFSIEIPLAEGENILTATALEDPPQPYSWRSTIAIIRSQEL